MNQSVKRNAVTQRRLTGWRRWYDNLRLFWKIALLCVAIVVPLTLVSVWLISQEFSRVVEANAGARLEELAYNAADKLDRNLFERYGDVQAFAQSPAAVSMNPRQIQAWMNTMTLTYQPIYRLMVVADLNGKLIAVSGVGADGQRVNSAKLLGRDVSNERWYRDTAFGATPEGSSLVENLQTDPLLAAVYGGNAALGMSFSAPIRGADGEIIGVWSNRFNWGVAEKILSEVRERARSNVKTVEFTISDTNGRNVYTPNAQGLLQTTDGGTRLAFQRAMKPGDTGYLRGKSYFRQSGAPALIAYYHSSGYSTYPGLGWIVSVSQELSEVSQERLTLLSLLYLLAGLIVAAVLLGVFLVSRQVTQRVGGLARAAAGLAAGDINQRVTDASSDEIGHLAQSFGQMMAYQNQMAGIANHISDGDLRAELEPKSEVDALGIAFQRMSHNLRGLINEIQRSSTDLSSASSQILASTSQQASGVSEQSAAVAQTTATVEEVKASADQAVDMAGAVNENAQAATRVAALGVDAARDATQGMSDIRARVSQISENILALSEQTQAIGEIIATVGDLADQSNLLALNAAIEAARAGEHGKGFAVVAQEIRLLAEQSKSATAQVRGILEDIQRATNTAVMTTEQGLKVADVGSTSLERVVDTITELADVIQQSAYSAQLIGASVRQHSIGMEQIAAAMNNINTATAENLLSTRHTKSAAEELTRLAERLKDLTDDYLTTATAPTP